MTSPIVKISSKQARRLALTRQGLHRPASFGRGKKAVAAAIRQLSYVQIDTISVVARAHDHVLWSRVPNYRERHLLDLQLKDRQIFEYWAHAAAYLPIERYRFTHHTRQKFLAERDGWPKSDAALKNRVLDRIRADGPLRSKDFAAPPHTTGNTWWQWKPAKLALQRLYFEGALMVSHREGFQRVFDLPERVLPPGLNLTAPTDDEYADYLIDSFLGAHGFGTPTSIAYLRRGAIKNHVAKRLQQRHDSGELIKICWARSDEHFTKASILESMVSRLARRARVLSPFDNTVIQRQRLSNLFGFDYQIECYVPKEKRIHGYYVQPILLGDQFAGRLDAKADRKSKVFHVYSIQLEKRTDPAELAGTLLPELQQYALFNGCEHLSFSESIPFRSLLQD